MHLSQEQAEGFYAEHKERPFFNDLVAFMTSGPVVVQALEGEGAILKNRDLMGATNPKDAEAGTIRADFASSIDANAVHGSDSAASAEREIAYFSMITKSARAADLYTGAALLPPDWLFDRGYTMTAPAEKRIFWECPKPSLRPILSPWGKTFSRYSGAAMDSPAWCG